MREAFRPMNGAMQSINTLFQRDQATGTHTRETAKPEPRKITGDPDGPGNTKVKPLKPNDGKTTYVAPATPRPLTNDEYFTKLDGQD